MTTPNKVSKCCGAKVDMLVGNKKYGHLCLKCGNPCKVKEEKPDSSNSSKISNSSISPSPLPGSERNPKNPYSEADQRFTAWAKGFIAGRALTASLKDEEIAELKKQLKSVREQRDAAGDREKWYQHEVAELQAARKAEAEKLIKPVESLIDRIDDGRALGEKLDVSPVREALQALKAEVIP